MVKATQKKLYHGAKQETPVKTGIIPTDSWINVSENGKAVFINIPEKDLVLTEYQGEQRVSFVTSMVSIENLVNGKNKGVKLGRFKD